MSQSSLGTRSMRCSTISEVSDRLRNRNKRRRHMRTRLKREGTSWRWSVMIARNKLFLKIARSLEKQEFPIKNCTSSSNRSEISWYGSTVIAICCCTDPTLMENKKNRTISRVWFGLFNTLCYIRVTLAGLNGSNAKQIRLSWNVFFHNLIPVSAFHKTSDEGACSAARRSCEASWVHNQCRSSIGFDPSENSLSDMPWLTSQIIICPVMSADARRRL